MKTLGEDAISMPRKEVLLSGPSEGTKSSDTLIWDLIFQPPELGDNRCVLKPPLCGPLLRQPQNTNISPETLQLIVRRVKRVMVRAGIPSFPCTYHLGPALLCYAFLLFPLNPGCSELRPREVSDSLKVAQLARGRVPWLSLLCPLTWLEVEFPQRFEKPTTPAPFPNLWSH